MVFYPLVFNKSHNSLLKTGTTCLIITWFNPHVYLDTVVLIGAISSQYIVEKLEFFIGASFASFVFFFALGYGARVLEPVFKSTLAWKTLDFIIAIIMWTIVAGLISRAI